MEKVRAAVCACVSVCARVRVRACLRVIPDHFRGVKLKMIDFYVIYAERVVL